MDYNHPDHFQMSRPMIKLKSSDGEVFQVEVKVAKLSLVFKAMLDDLDVIENEVIPIPPNGPKISGKILGKIILWANHHKDDPAEAEEDEKEEKPTDDISSWDAEFLEVDRKTLIQIIWAANYLNIKGLLDVTCKTVAKVIKGMAVEDVRRTFHIQNDFSLADEQRLREEYKWCEGVEIPTNSVQEMHPEAGQAIESNDEASESLRDIFGNPVILNHIMEQLSNSKLLELSFVSSSWKKEARIVMKKRGNVTALLDCDGGRECGTVFQAFAANLETLKNEAIYSGMTICVRPAVACKGPGSVKLERIHESIVAWMRGNLKRLSIYLDYPEVCWNARDCPNFLLLRLLLRDFICDLEHLTLRLDSFKFTEPYIQEFLSHGRGPYPKLKVLKLYDVCRRLNQETFGNQIRMLLSRAPNLEEIHTYGDVSLRENLMEGREGVVHVHDADHPITMEDISENVIPALRLKRIEFCSITNLNLGRFNEKARSLLRTCCAETLEYLHMESVSAVLFMSYGIKLKNVKELYIVLGYDYFELKHFEPRILSILSHFDFTNLLPKLNKVSIDLRVDMQNTSMHNLGVLSRDMNAIIEQVNADRAEPSLPLAGNIKHLNLYQRGISVDEVQFFAHMFPAIEELGVYGLEAEDYAAFDEDFPVESAWELWPNLKRIHGVGLEEEDD